MKLMSLKRDILTLTSTSTGGGITKSTCWNSKTDKMPLSKMTIITEEIGQSDRTPTTMFEHSEYLFIDAIYSVVTANT